MNEVLKMIYRRRSVRAYKSDPVPEESIKLLLEAAIYAPCGRNSQLRHFTAICNPSAIEELDNALKIAVTVPGYESCKSLVGNGSYHISYHAPVLIICSSDVTTVTTPEANCAVALENIFLAAEAVGLSSCWINQLNNVCEEQAFRSILTKYGVPENYRIFGCAAIGYNAGKTPEPSARRDGITNIVWA